MSMTNPKRVKKLLSIITSILMLVQPILPVVPSFISPVFAQDATPAITPVPTPDPTETIAPTGEATPTPTDEVTPTETIEPTPTEAATPTTEPTPTDTPTETPTAAPSETPTPTPDNQTTSPSGSNNEPPKETGPPQQGDILDGAFTEATPTSTVTVVEPVEEGVLQAVVLQNVDAVSLDLDNVNPSNSATLATDKADYAPTDTAIITGTDFTPGETYNLTISSLDPPATSTIIQVTADENGTFIYAYQLDGIYRPNYSAKVTDIISDDIVASTTFTDTSTTVEICHASDSQSNPYITNHPNKTADVGGHDGHNGVVWYLGIADHSWGDIIPPFSYSGGTYPGQNWTTEGQAIYNNDCKVPSDLIITKTNNLTDATGTTNQSFVWKIRIDNVGLDDANFHENEFILTDNLPNTNVTYGTPSIATNNVTGSSYITCQISSYNLTCKVNNNKNVTIKIGGYVEVSFTTTFSTNGTKTNPRTGGICKVDPNDTIHELTETNNTCTDTVTINSPPGTIELRKIWSGIAGQTTLNIGTSVGGSQIDTQLTGAAGAAPQTTGQNNVTAGMYYVSEIGGLDTYDASLACYNDANNNGSNDGESAVAIDANNGVAVDVNQHVICTFTNTKLRNITACKYDDHNGNGAKEDSEPLLDNWSMTLTPGSVTQTTVNGCTTFTNLSPGLYSVAETLKTDWSNTTPLSQNVTLTSRQNETLYFGNFACATISGMKWEDLDGDGTKDTGEPALADWTINLNGTEASDITDVNGGYSFKVCRAGTFTVSETIPDQKTWYQTSPGGASPNHQIKVTSGGTYTGKDFGNTRYAKIYGVKYRDNDGDGTLDANDLTATLAGWVFDLYDGTTNFILKSFTTDTDGYYEFTGLAVNQTYYILEQLKPGWTQTIGPTPIPTPFAVQSGETKQINFANFENMAVTVCKVEDADGSLTTTTDRTPVSGWQVDLLKNNQTYDNTQVTGRDGCYTWTDLAPGSYSTQEESQTGWQHLTSTSHDFGTLENGHTYSHTFINTHMGKIIVEKQTLPDQSTQAFGFTADYDANGFTLTDGQTNDSGYLMPGTYSLAETAVTGWDLTGTTCSDQSNPGSISLSAGETVTCTFTNTQLGSIAGRKYNDINGNGIRGDNEAYLDGWTIHLFDDQWTQIAQMNTGDTGTLGQYKFTQLTPGSYYVCEDLKSGWTQSEPSSGETRNGTYCKTVNIDPGQTVTGQHFGNIKLGIIQSRKYNDADGDSVRDEGESWLNDWTVRLYKQGEGWEFVDAKVTGHTGTEGQYRFENLSFGTYFVCEVLQNGWIQTDPSSTEGYANSSGAPEEAPRCRKFIVDQSGDESIGEKHFGNQGRGTITVHKDVDTDGDGKTDVFDDTSWTWDIDGAGDFATGSTQDVASSTYQISEDQKDDYHFVSLVCDDVTQESSTARIIVDPGDTKVCTYTNARDTGTITIDKETLPSFSEKQFTINVNQGLAGDSVTIHSSLLADQDSPDTYSVITGEYWLEELSATGWDLTNAECTPNEDSENAFDPRADSFIVHADDDIYCAFTNTQRGRVIVTKYNDENGDGFRDEGEDVLSGWTMHLNGDEKQEITGENGEALFQNLLPQTYTLTEDLQKGWKQTQLSCGRNEDSFADDTADDTVDNGRFTLSPGETQRCVVGNQRLDPILTITKENNAAGDMAPGSSVLFTLTVTVTQSAAHNVVVTDLPAGGFTYRTGSWTSSSTARGDLKSLGVTTEPTYASPGLWTLGDMVMNEVVTLTYIADISADQKPGLYKDLAWAYGCKFETDCTINDGDDVIALAVNPGYIDETNHVGTSVNIAKNTQNGATLNPTTGEVLGASTELPATGADEAWLTLAALLFLMGIGLITAGKYTRRFHV